MSKHWFSYIWKSSSPVDCAQPALDIFPRDASRREDVLSFHLRPTNTPKDAFEESDAYSQEFIHSLGLKVSSGCWSTVDLNTPVIFDFIREARARITRGEATFYGLCALGQTLLESDEAPGEWYQFTSSRMIERDRDADGIETCKAYKMPGNIHIASGTGYNQYVSEKFKALVEMHQLTGIAFEWVKDTGKYRAPQWYLPVAELPIGRGIDHPWFDLATLKGSDSNQPRHPKWRTGVWNFDLSQVKKRLQITDQVYQDLFALFSLPRVDCFDLRIVTPRLYMRSFLPSTDFAYNWDGEDNTYNRYCPRTRGLCFNHKVRNILLENRLISEQDLTILQIVDAVPAGSCLLDEQHHLPGPLITREERERHQRILALEWDHFQSTQKPVRQATLREALKMMREEKAARKEDFNRAARKAELGGFPLNITSNWVSVLALSNGCDMNEECSLLSLGEIQSATRELAEEISTTFDVYPFDTPLITIGTAANGDWFVLADTGVPAEDTSVMRVSHEDFSLIDTWDTIPMYIIDMLTGFYE